MKNIRRNRKSGSATKQARKIRLGPIDTGVRPGGVIHPWHYWKGKQRLIIPRLLLESNLSKEGILCWGLLRMYGGGKNLCIPSQETLGNDFKFCKRTARRYLKKLRTEAFINAIRRGDKIKGGRTTDQYEPLANEFWNQHKPGLAGALGEPLRWSDFTQRKLPAYFIPLELVGIYSAGALLCYGVLSAELSETIRECTPTIRRLALTLRCSRWRIFDYLKELVRGGDLVVVPRYENGNRLASTYRFTRPKSSVSAATEVTTANGFMQTGEILKGMAEQNAAVAWLASNSHKKATRRRPSSAKTATQQPKPKRAAARAGG